MTMYLILKYEPLNDQYECDANRTPIAIVSDWRAWCEEQHTLNYSIEVWKYENNKFTCIDIYY